MSKNIYNPLNLDNPVHIDFNDMSDHESINHCFGEMNGFYGKKHTEEYKEQKVHDSRNQWYNAPQEYRNMMAGYTKQMGLNNKGRKHSPEVNAKKHPRLSCSVCGKTMNKGNFVRYGHTN